MISEENLERILSETEKGLKKVPHVRFVELNKLDSGEGWADFIVSVKIEDTYLVESK